MPKGLVQTSPWFQPKMSGPELQSSPWSFISPRTGPSNTTHWACVWFTGQLVMFREFSRYAKEWVQIYCQDWFLWWTLTGAKINLKGCQQQAKRLWRWWGLSLQCMCCALAIPASLYFRGRRNRVKEVWWRLELPEGRWDGGGQRRVCRKYSSWDLNWGTIPSVCGVLILYIGYVQ